MKDIVIFDLDGTLANGDHRVSHIMNHPKNWTKYFAECHKDEPINHVIEVLDNLYWGGYMIWIVSGRSDEVRDKTVAWLKENDIRYNKLIMRKAGDYTADDVLKISWLHDGSIPKERILCVFDDRDRVVKAWRTEGIPCFQVAPGAF